MKYFVKINIGSVKINPRAGRILTVIPTFKSVELTLRSNGVAKESDIKKIEKLCKEIGFIMDAYVIQHTDKISHPPEPNYFYKHYDKKIECKYCKAKIKVSELESDEIDRCVSSDTICPKCKRWGCCEVEFQTIEDLIKEKPEIFRDLKEKTNEKRR